MQKFAPRVLIAAGWGVLGGYFLNSLIESSLQLAGVGKNEAVFMGKVSTIIISLLIIFTGYFLLSKSRE